MSITVDGAEVDYSRLVMHQESISLYIESGIEPGSGLSAILSNNLRAVVMVDADTFDALPAIYRWLVNYAPSQAWGSPEKVAAWIKERRLERR